MLPDGVLEEGNEILLPRNIQFDVAGTYTCHVATSAGNSSDDFIVTVISEFYNYI